MPSCRGEPAQGDTLAVRAQPPSDREPSFPPPMATTRTTRLSARFLSRDEQALITDQVRAGASLRAIDRELGRPASMVSREVRRNRDEAGRHYPFTAHLMALRRLVRPKERD